MTIIYESATDQVRQIVHHHAVLRRGLERRAGALCEAAENGIGSQRQIRTFREYLTGHILPHAEAEERTLYPAAAVQARGSEQVRTLTAEHRELAYLAGRLQPGADDAEAATVSDLTALLADITSGHRRGPQQPGSRIVLRHGGVPSPSSSPKEGRSS